MLKSTASISKCLSGGVGKRYLKKRQVKKKNKQKRQNNQRRSSNSRRRMRRRRRGQKGRMTKWRAGQGGGRGRGQDALQTRTPSKDAIKKADLHGASEIRDERPVVVSAIAPVCEWPGSAGGARGHCRVHGQYDGLGRCAANVGDLPSTGRLPSDLDL